MNLLLDTHIWIWSLREPDGIRPSVADALQDPENQLWISPMSFWEVMILGSKRRLFFDPDPATWIRTALAKRPLREAPITGRIAILARQLDLATEDPGDRIIAATAQLHELTLVTSDKHLLACKEILTLRN